MAVHLGIEPGKEAQEMANAIVATAEQAGLAVEVICRENPWEALAENEIDFFVAEGERYLFQPDLPPVCVARRDSLRDVIVAADETVQLENFAAEWKIAVFSARQEALLKRYFGHIAPVLIDPTVEPSLDLLSRHACDGMMLAQASARRLGLNAQITQKCSPHTFPPPPGRGMTLLLGAATSDEGKRLAKAVGRKTESIAWEAERRFAKQMKQQEKPINFGIASIIGDSMSMKGGWISADGQEMHQTEISLDRLDPLACADRLVERLHQ
ncbi:MAG: hypothetical protein AAGM67_09490 [Bacteroidota bacterium]